jgi:hypothetical protein
LGFSFQCLPLAISIISISYFQGEIKKVEMSFLMNLLFLVVTLFHNLMILVSRGVSLRFYRLRSVIDFLTSDAVVKLDNFESYPSCNNSLKKKTFFGIFIILAAVIYNNIPKLYIFR